MLKRERVQLLRKSVKQKHQEKQNINNLGETTKSWTRKIKRGEKKVNKSLFKRNNNGEIGIERKVGEPLMVPESVNARESRLVCFCSLIKPKNWHLYTIKAIHFFFFSNNYIVSINNQHQCSSTDNNKSKIE